MGGDIYGCHMMLYIHDLFAVRLFPAIGAGEGFRTRALRGVFHMCSARAGAPCMLRRPGNRLPDGHMLHHQRKLPGRFLDEGFETPRALHCETGEYLPLYPEESNVSKQAACHANRFSEGTLITPDVELIGIPEELDRAALIGFKN